MAAPPPGNPTIVAPVEVQVQQNQQTAFAPFNTVSIADSIAEANDETVTVVLTDGIGLLSASGAGVSGSGSPRLTISGDLAQVNSDLATLTDDETLPGADEISITASDSGGGSAGPSEIFVDVISPPGNPAIIAPGSVMVDENEQTPLFGPNGVSVSDSIAATNAEGVVVVLTDGKGLLSATGAGVSGSGTTELTVSGLLSQVNADLATLTDNESSTGLDEITVAVRDGGGSSAGPVGISVDSIAGPGNPFIFSAPSATVHQSVATAISGVSVGDNIAQADGETVTVRVSDSDGLLSATGPGVSGSGTTELTISGLLPAINAALGTLSDTDASTAADTITITASDSGGGVGPPNDIEVTVTPRPTVKAHSVSVWENATVAASKMIASVSNPGGDEITRYEFYDHGGGTGHLTVNGVAQADDKWINVAAAKLGTVDYVGGTSPGKETISVRVYDATTKTWSVGGHAAATTTVEPVVKPHKVSVAEGASVAASTMIASVSNPSADNLTKYRFYDYGGGTGHFAVGGVAKPDHRWIYVPAADLSSIDYVGGASAGSQSVAIEVYDATTKTYSASAHLTATTTAPEVPAAVNSAIAVGPGNPIQLAAVVLPSFV